MITLNTGCIQITMDTNSTNWLSQQKPHCTTERKPSNVNDCWDDEIREDQYGEKLKAVPLDEVISLLKERLFRRKQPIRRFVLALALLKSVKHGWSSSSRLTVLFYATDNPNLNRII